MTGADWIVALVVFLALVAVLAWDTVATSRRETDEARSRRRIVRELRRLDSERQP